MLTQKQYDLLVYIHNHLEKTGLSPSFDEMRDQLGLKSKSGVHRLILALEERGFLKRLANRARALEVLKMPENLGTEKLPIRSRRIDVLEAEALKTGMPMVASNSNDVISLPMYGRIAAGTPIDALQDETNFVDIPSGMVGSGQYYALEIDGDSMMEAGILDGDTVIIERSEVARDGDIVVAYLENGDEATLKEFEKRGDKVFLKPANRHYKTLEYSASEVKVQGKLFSLLRKY